MRFLAGNTGLIGCPEKLITLSAGSSRRDQGGRGKGSEDADVGGGDKGRRSREEKRKGSVRGKIITTSEGA